MSDINGLHAAPKAYLQRNWLWAFIVAFLIIPALSAVTVFTMLPVISFFVLVLGGGVYTVIVIISLIIDWKKYLSNPTETGVDVIKNFGLFRQQATLLISLVIILTSIVGSVASLQVGDSGSVFTGNALFVVASILGVAGWFAIFINAKWIFNEDVRRSEWEAVYTRTGSWKLITVNLIASAISWVCGSGLSVYAIANFLNI